MVCKNHPLSCYHSTILPLALLLIYSLDQHALQAESPWLKGGQNPADVPRLVKHVDESFLRQARALTLPV